MLNNIILNSKNYNELFLKYFPDDFWNLSKDEYDICYTNLYKETFKFDNTEITTSEIRIPINDEIHIQLWEQFSIEFRNKKGDFIKSYGINGINYSNMTKDIIYYFFDEDGTQLNFYVENDFRNYIKKTPYIRLKKLKRIFEEDV